MPRVTATPKDTTSQISPQQIESWRQQGRSDETIAEYISQTRPGFGQQYQKIKHASGGDPNATRSFLNFYFYGDADYSPSAPVKKGFAGRILDGIWNNLQQDAVDVGQAVENYAQGEQGFGNTVAQVGGNIASVGASPLVQAGTQVVSGALSLAGKIPGVGSAAEQIGQSDFVQQGVMPAVEKIGESYEQARDNSPLLQSAEAVTEGAFDAVQALGVGQGAKMGLQAGKAGMQKGAAAAKTGFNAVRHPIQTLKGVTPQNGPLGRLQETITAQSDDAARLAAQPPEYQQAVASGVDEPFVKLVSEASPEERALMLKQAEAMELGATDLLQANKAKEVGGQVILNRAVHVVKARRAAGQQIGNIVKATSNEVVPLQRTQQTITQLLDDYGLVLDQKGKLMSFGAVPKSDLPFFQELLKRVKYGQNDMVSNVARSHANRQWMFNEMSLAQLQQKPFSSLVERFAKQVHSSMLDDVTQVVPQYRPLAQSYAEMSQPLQDFAKFIGFKGSLDDLAEEGLRTGEVAMRIFGNASARPRDVVGALDQVAQKYGYRTSTNIERLLRFADRMEDFYPTSQTRSLQGNVERAGQKLIEGKPIQAAVSTVTSKAEPYLSAIGGKRTEDQIRAIRSLLSK